MSSVLPVLLLLATGSPAPGSGHGTASQGGPCLRIDKAGTAVTGDVKICPGRYRIPDRADKGVLVVTGSSTRIDLTGVTLESGDTIPSEFVGLGIASRGVDSVTIRGGRVKGFRHGIRLEGGRGHRVSGIDLSGSRAQRLRSTPDTYDEADWLDIFSPDSVEAYGGGLLLVRTTGTQVSGVVAHGSQNGIGLIASRDALIADNDVSGNSGWGIHLWQSARNTILRNRADHNVRCEGRGYRRGCDSAALLLRHESDSNLVADNSLRTSGDGFFLSGQRGRVGPSIGNLVIRNDATGAFHNAFESTFSSWNVFLENRADSSDYGFWLGYSRGNVVRGNIVIGSRSTAIAIEHGGENEIGGNTIIGAASGIRLFTRTAGDDPSTDYRIDDNTIAQVGQGIVLQHTTKVKLRGNLLDGVEDGLVVDSAGADATVQGNVFLTARRWLISAVTLDAGGNFWATQDLAAAQRQVQGRVTLAPFKTARAAGY